MLIVYAFVLIAVGMDLRSMKISNRLILVGIVLSLIRRLFCEGIGGIFTGIFLISFPVIFLYLLFLAGALGAGDIKLFSLIGGFVNLKELMWCIVFAFIFAAVFSVVKMLYYRTFFLSIKNGLWYFYGLFKGDRGSYLSKLGEKGQIRFSIAILLGLVTTDICFVL